MLDELPGAGDVAGFDLKTGVNPKNVRIAFDSTLYQLFSPKEGFIYLIIASFLISSMFVLILPKD